MNLSVTNILDLADAETYTCVVEAYLSGHSQLVLRVYRPSYITENTFFLIFETVKYFEGPLSWRNADFRVGTADECKELLALLRQGGLEIPEEMLNAFLKRYRLFAINSPSVQVRIFAEKIYRATNVPRISYEPPGHPDEITDITPPPIN